MDAKSLNEKPSPNPLKEYNEVLSAILKTCALLAIVVTFFQNILPFFTPIETAVSGILSVVGLILLVALLFLNLCRRGLLFHILIMRYFMAFLLASYITGFVHYWSEAHDTDTDTFVEIGIDHEDGPLDTKKKNGVEVNQGSEKWQHKENSGLRPMSPELRIAIIDLVGVYLSLMFLVATLTPPHKKAV